MTDRVIQISIADQELRLARSDVVQSRFAVSTARNGAGELRDSEATPRGWHIVRAKIGAGLPENTVFTARRPSGEIYTPQLRADFPDRDWILTRILWLSGLEIGRNRLGRVDTMCRYIYIHGSPEEEPMGVPMSHGCIRMRNKDVVELFDQVPVGVRVWIQEETFRT